MFGWFKKRELQGRRSGGSGGSPNVGTYEWIVAKFRVRRAEIESSTPWMQLAFSAVLAIYWRHFILAHGSPGAFAELPRHEQMAYFKKVMAVVSGYFEQNDLEKAVPIEMLSMYLYAIIGGHREFEEETADFLDEYAKSGWELPIGDIKIPE